MVEAVSLWCVERVGGRCEDPAHKSNLKTYMYMKQRFIIMCVYRQACYSEPEGGYEFCTYMHI